MGLKEIWLITNYSCNNKCRWCYTKSKGFPLDIMPLPYAKNVLLETSKFGINKCTLIGGEPLLYPYLFDLVKYGSSLDFFMKIVTNAVLLNDEKIVEKLLENGVSYIAMSIHGIDKFTYRNNTQTDNFDRVVKSLSNLQKYNANYTTLSTINELNVNHIYDIALYLHENNVKSIIFNIAVPTTRDQKQNYSLPLDEIAKTIQENYLRLKNAGIIAGFYASIPLCLFDSELLEKMIQEGYLIPLSKGGCNIYDSSGFAIDPKGNIISCCKKHDNSLLKTMGKNGEFLYADKFDILWDEIKNHFGPLTFPKPIAFCKVCSLRNLCIGGCQLFWEYDDPLSYILESNNKNQKQKTQ